LINNIQMHILLNSMRKCLCCEFLCFFSGVAEIFFFCLTRLLHKARGSRRFEIVTLSRNVGNRLENDAASCSRRTETSKYLMLLGGPALRLMANYGKHICPMGSERFMRLWLPVFSGFKHIKPVRLSAQSTGRFYPQRSSLVFVSVKD
jgi:hypothetical protein